MKCICVSVDCGIVSSHALHLSAVGVSVASYLWFFPVVLGCAMEPCPLEFCRYAWQKHVGQEF